MAGQYPNGVGNWHRHFDSEPLPSTIECSGCDKHVPEIITRRVDGVLTQQCSDCWHLFNLNEAAEWAAEQLRRAS